MRNRLITAAISAGAVAVGLLTAGCGSLGSGQAVTYAPAAYGANGQCYYVSSPAEAVALQQAGLCPRSWIPAPMPLSWEEEYYDYYDSPAYYGTYVPAGYRTVYVSRERSFGTRYRTTIVTLSRSATYRSSSGGTVKGSTVTGKTRFGSGCSFSCAGTKYGSGSLRSGSSKTGTSSGSRSGGSRSGSLRSGGRGH